MYRVFNGLSRIAYHVMKNLILCFTLWYCSQIAVNAHELLFDFLNFQKDHREINLTEKCASALSEIKNGIKDDQLWAIKVRDASGKSGTGFVWGNNYWLGQERPCYWLNRPREIILTSTKTRRMHRNDTAVISKVPVEYRMFYATHTSPVQFDGEMFNYVALHVGLCFPKACETSEINEMAKMIFQSETFNQAVYGKVAFVKTKTLDLRDNFFREPFTILLM